MHQRLNFHLRLLNSLYFILNTSNYLNYSATHTFYFTLTPLIFGRFPPFNLSNLIHQTLRIHQTLIICITLMHQRLNF